MNNISEDKIREDIRGVKPYIGCLIAFNPPYYKGIKVGECIGFTSGGLPKVKMNELDYEDNYYNEIYYPKTGFVVVNK